MRILSIRLENLASLAGRHVVDLDSGPLSDAGLFAITGPTGSGKTTILDALCLALYGDTPRAAAASGDKWGAAGAPPSSILSAQDVRSLLHRGAGGGFAEVDFVGGDHRRYRARWSVHRAGDSARGNLQKSRHQLMDLETGVAMGSGKATDTKALIEARLGLTFEQFCRSVLLAQGEFAAFLKANSKDDRKDRALLLERMTGAGIYRDISRATHVRCAEEAGKLQALEARHGLLQRLSGEERASLEADLASIDAERLTLQAEHEETQAALGWHWTRLALDAELDEAARRHGEATVSAAAAAERKAHLAHVRRAHEELRQPIEWADRAMESLQSSKARRLEAEVAYRGAAVSRDRAAARRDADAQLLQTASQAREAVQPALQQARAKDDQLAQAARELSGHDAKVETAAARSAEARQRVREAELGLAQAAVERAEAEAFLARHPELEPVAAQWPHLEHQLGRAALGHLESVRLRGQRPDLGQAADEAETALAALGSRLSALRAEATQAHELRKALGAQRGEILDLELRAERRTLDEELRRLDALGRAEAALAEHAAATQSVLSDAEARQTRVQGTAVRQVELSTELVGVTAALQEAEATAREIERQHGLAAHRHDLAPGAPCPLCGSTEHPFRKDESKTDGALAALLDQLNGRVDELTLRRDALRAEAEHHRAMLATDREHVSSSLSRLAELADTLASQRKAVDRAAEALEWSLVEDGDDPIGDRVAALTHQSEGLDAILASAQRLDALLRAAMETEDQMRRLADAAQVAHEEARASAEVARQALAAHDALVRGQAEALAETRAVLQAALGHHAAWLEPLDLDPGALLSRIEADVERWRRATIGRDSLDARIGTLRAEHEKAEAVLTERLGKEAEVREAHAAATAYLADLRAARAELLGGRPADEVGRGLEARVRGAEAALQGSDAALGEASEAAARADQQRNDLADRARDAQTDLELAGAARDAALAAFTAPDPPLAPEAARALLSRDRAWIQAESEDLGAIDDALGEALVRLMDRRARLEAHLDPAKAPRPHSASLRRGEAREPPAASEARVEEPLATVDAVAALTIAAAAQKDRLHGLGEAIAARRQALLADDAQATQATALFAEVTSRRVQVELWSRLDELIGSADGSKLPLFAQRLTFDALLAEANVHLAGLYDRYLLEPNPHVDLELQIVDRTFAGEIRPVSSLSGGESFLVSLALALALASLSSRGVHVGSLFVDEGFGTLDPETLDTALDALEQLRSGGRQVGIISHVEGLADRIGARVEILPMGGGRSTLRCLGPDDSTE